MYSRWLNSVIPTFKREWKKGDRTRLARLCRVNHLCMLKSIRNSLCTLHSLRPTYTYCTLAKEGPWAVTLHQAKTGEFKGQSLRRVVNRSVVDPDRFPQFPWKPPLVDLKYEHFMEWLRFSGNGTPSLATDLRNCYYGSP